MQEAAAMTEQQTASMKEIAGVSEQVNRLAQSLEIMVHGAHSTGITLGQSGDLDCPEAQLSP